MPIKRSGQSSHPYYHYRHRHHQPKHKRYWMFFIFLPITLALVCWYLYIQPVSPIKTKEKIFSVQEPANIELSWPATSQAAIGSIDQGVLSAKPNATQKPTASTAKLITVLTILKKKPLTLGKRGPTITITQKDTDIYNNYFAKDGSVAQVQVGEKLTEYQMLQGTLLPSANNYADTLAIWAFGSLENYQQAAKKTIKEINMKNTNVGPDASGFSPETTSTPEDLTKLAIAAMKNDVIREIVKQDHVDLPVAGTKQNTNWLLGAEGIVGIKTGNTEQAGGVYIFASDYSPNGKHHTTIVGAVQGEPNVIAAIHQARLLLNQARPYFTVKKLIKNNDQVATYVTPWGETANAIASSDLETVVWKGKPLTPQIKLKTLNAPIKKGTVIGSISYGQNSTDLVLENSINTPSWQWRILRNI